MSQDPSNSLFGPHGDPCAGCGAPLAADQRYCLACGARRADTRLPFLDILRGGEGAVTTTALVPFGTPVGAGTALALPAAYTAPGADETGVLASIRRNTGVVGLVGCLLLALLIGVLLGQGGSSGPGKAEVISVGTPAAAAAPVASAPAATTPTGATGTSGAAGASTAASAAPAPADTSAAGAAAAKSSTPAPAAAKPIKGKAPTGGSPDAASQNAVKKLKSAPKVTTTGGKPKPVSKTEQNKPAGGGSAVQTFG